MSKAVLIAGNGKLADNLLKGLSGYLTDYKIDCWDNRNRYSQNNLVIVHVGSGRQLPEVLDFCERTQSPLIQGSTGMNIKREDFNFTFIDASNFDILMLKFMYMLNKIGDIFKKYKISITESHQLSKKSVPGTAVEIARSLGINPSEIKSIRNPEEQKNDYGIPKEFLDLHAFHDICIQDDNASINFKTLVKGHESYLSGLSAVINNLKNLQKKYYHVLDLIDMRLI
jgi:4-hydroxy-tetrahydrodipicolinate reductase